MNTFIHTQVRRILSNGQTIIELLLAISLTSIMLPAIIGAIITTREGAPQQNQRLEATFYLREAREAVRVIREAGWDNIATAGTYHPQVSGGTWSLVGGAETIDQYTRTIEIRDVERDAGGAIVPSGSGTPDPSTKEIEITVSWDNPIVSEVFQTFYISRYLNNSTFIETTEAEFQSGTLNGVTISNTSGGEVLLGAGGTGNWCEPVPEDIVTFDLPKSGVANSVSAIEGQVIAGTGENASGVSLADISVSNANPPVPSQTGTYDCCKSNAVFTEQNYAYIGTDTNNKEVVIVNIATPPYSESGYFDATGNADANDVWVKGTIGYVLHGGQITTFNLTSKTGSRAELATTSTGATGLRLFVRGNYAYVARDIATNQLRIYEINQSTGAITYRGQVQVDGGKGRGIYVNESEDRAYLITEANATKAEFFIIDVSSKTSPTVISGGSYDTNGMDPKGVVVVTGNRAIVVGIGGEEYQVINISNESSPTRCGGLQADVGINDIDSVLEVDGDAYSYILTKDTTKELQIIPGGPGGSYSTTGDFVSSIFDAGQTSAFERIKATVIKPSQTTISLQVAGADAVSGSCAGATYNFVGPDGTSGSFFDTITGSLIKDSLPQSNDGIGYENPARCFRYKVYLDTTESTQTPEFHDITVNYVP